MLDSWAVCQGVGERNAYLNQIDPSASNGLYHIQGSFWSGITQGHIRHQGRPAFVLSPLKCVRNAFNPVHSSLLDVGVRSLPKAFITVSRSLSPRPERLTNRIRLGSNPGARRMAPGATRDDSRAGRMPARRAKD